MKRLLSYSILIQKAFGGLILGAIAIVVLADVLTRELGLGGISGAARLAVYLMITFGFLCIPIAASQGNHLRIRILDISWGRLEWLQPRLTFLTSALAMAGFTWFSAMFVLESYELNETSAALKIPMWWVQLMIPVSFAFLCFQYLLYAIDPDLSPPERGTA
jgi:TRAP-type C4-dicarboxylate transport system permease small subunit